MSRRAVSRVGGCWQITGFCGSEDDAGECVASWPSRRQRVTEGVGMGDDIEIVYSHSSYKCTCPLPVDEDDEIRLAQECYEREQEHEQQEAARAPAAPDAVEEGE